MSDPRDECREVTLPSGEQIRVRAAGPMSAEAVAALGDLVDAARRKMAVEHPPEPGTHELYERLRARMNELDISLRGVAFQTGVRFAVLFRIGQGLMPDGEDLAAIETWLTNGDTDA